MSDMYRLQIESLIGQGHTTHAIAEALDVPISVVRAIAGQTTPEDAADMIGVLKAVALDRAAPPAARLKAAVYLIDESKGRNDKMRGGVAELFPVIELATRLGAAQSRALPAAARRAAAAGIEVTDAQEVTP